MREILFRGQRCDNGEWVQGFYVRADHHWHKNGIHKDWIICGASANGGWFALNNKYAVKSETVGQFTGLTDKNGKKIFEGDILAWDNVDEDPYTGEKNCALRDLVSVIWDNGSMGALNIGYIRLSDGRKRIYENGEIFALSDELNVSDYVVFGNVHDNPELLEVQHED